MDKTVSYSITNYIRSHFKNYFVPLPYPLFKVCISHWKVLCEHNSYNDPKTVDGHLILLEKLRLKTFFHRLCSNSLRNDSNVRNVCKFACLMVSLFTSVSSIIQELTDSVKWNNLDRGVKRHLMIPLLPGLAIPLTQILDGNVKYSKITWYLPKLRNINRQKRLLGINLDILDSLGCVLNLKFEKKCI